MANNNSLPVSPKEVAMESKTRDWQFPSLGIIRTHEEITALIWQFDPREQKRNMLWQALMQLTNGDGEFANWLRENEEVWRKSRLYPRYYEFLKSDLGIISESLGLSGPGQYRFQFEIEVVFLADYGFSTEEIISILSGLLGRFDKQDAHRSSFETQVYRVVRERRENRYDLQFASIFANEYLKEGSKLKRLAKEKPLSKIGL